MGKNRGSFTCKGKLFRKFSDLKTNNYTERRRKIIDNIGRVSEQRQITRSLNCVLSEKETFKIVMTFSKYNTIQVFMKPEALKILSFLLPSKNEKTVSLAQGQNTCLSQLLGSNHILQNIKEMQNYEYIILMTFSISRHDKENVKGKKQE